MTGVNIGDFGIQEGRRKERFFDLVKALDNVDGLDRLRISSIEPNLLSNEVIEFVAQSKRFVPHFHIPLRSEEHTSELQSLTNLVCRLLLEKKKKKQKKIQKQTNKQTKKEGTKRNTHKRKVR